MKTWLFLTSTREFFEQSLVLTAPDGRTVVSSVTKTPPHHASQWGRTTGGAAMMMECVLR